MKINQEYLRENVVKQKKQIDNGLKIYEENKNNYKKITDQDIITTKKVSKGLNELLKLIDNYIIRDGNDLTAYPVSTKLS